MPAKQKFYLTTSIAYVNGLPHVGYAAELTQADVLARWHRMLGEDVFFLTGTDENSLKLLKAAEVAGLTPQQLADQNAGRFRDLTETLGLSNDGFIRTTDEPKHFPGAQALWQKMEENGAIYKGTYEGLYCIDCEQFYTPKELLDGKCPIHGTEPEPRSEENYLFKLSQYGSKIRELIESGVYEVVPESRRNEVLSFLENELHDISFSRPAARLSMGVPVPGDESQTMYVWCDALANYLTGIGFGRDEAQFKHYWPADVHVIGKDIIRFHAVYWPAMLLAAGLELPKRLYVHGFFTVEGVKMSKSLGNVVDPFTLADKHGADALRYYLVAAMPYAGDGDYSERHFSEIHDSHLANDFGNLASRVLAMVEKAYDGVVPEGSPDSALKEHVGQTYHRLRQLLDDGSLAAALEALHALVITANRYVEQREPFKQSGQDQADTLYALVQVLGHLALLYQPFMPAAAATLQKRLGITQTGWDTKSLREFEKVPPGTVVAKGEALFPKTEQKL